VSDPKGTHKQKAVSNPKRTPEQKKAMSDPVRTREQDISKWIDVNGLELHTHVGVWHRKRYVIY